MKAVLKNGVILPQEPVPSDWSEGTELDVEKANSTDNVHAADELDNWFHELEAACSQMDSEDDFLLKQAILEVRQQEKELARKEAATEP